MQKMANLVVLQLVGMASGEPTPFDKQYLVEYDPTRGGTSPDGRPMVAHIVTTPERDKALKLTVQEAFKLYKQSYGIRLDGKPNRPLTAFNIQIIKENP